MHAVRRDHANAEHGLPVFIQPDAGHGGFVEQRAAALQEGLFQTDPLEVGMEGAVGGEMVAPERIDLRVNRFKAASGQTVVIPPHATGGGGAAGHIQLFHGGDAHSVFSGGDRGDGPGGAETGDDHIELFVKTRFRRNPFGPAVVQSAQKHSVTSLWSMASRASAKLPLLK